jgi:hypothetical protein
MKLSANVINQCMFVLMLLVFEMSPLLFWSACFNFNLFLQLFLFLWVRSSDSHDLVPYRSIDLICNLVEEI